MYTVQILTGLLYTGGENVARKEETDQAFQQLKSDLRDKKIGRLYFFYGEEVFLLQHYLQQMKKMLNQQLKLQ